MGDLLLKALADRIAGVIRESDTVARIGGDEFVVLLHGIHHDDHFAVAEKIRIEVRRAFLIETQTLDLSVSIGIALFPEQAADLLERSEHADQAMHGAKEKGANAVAFSDPASHARQRHRTPACKAAGRPAAAYGRVR